MQAVATWCAGAYLSSTGSCTLATKGVGKFVAETFAFGPSDTSPCQYKKSGGAQRKRSGKDAGGERISQAHFLSEGSGSSSFCPS